MGDEQTEPLDAGSEPTSGLPPSPAPDVTRATAPSAASPSHIPRPTSHIPARIGRYTITRVLGEGGMGTVYEAQQESPKRTVALKVIRAGYLSPELLRRFTQESQVLGRLQHPGIAQVHEAGMAKDERGHEVPFFAMEFIKGVPLTEYVNQKRLGTSDRLELVAKVCDAVYHAHQKGVIHRDLKPGNILVDESGQPKILDFGIARATDSDIQQTTLQTDIGQLIGTIPYMSPEQVSGDPNDLDTRSDVYALGVIAYELLAGRLPYDLQRKMIHEAARIIREEEPTRLSSINRTLKGDVETIVSKALEKDKVRRYQSAESLASDIRRYLKHEPITARPASTWYQLQKFSRRNTGLVIGVAAAFLLLIVGLTVSLYAFAQASRERDAKELARARAVAAFEFVTTSLKSSDPTSGGSQSTTIIDAMSSAIAEIERGRFKDDPETEAALQQTIALILLNNGSEAKAEPICRGALETRRRLFPRGSAEVVATLSTLARTLETLGRSAESEALSREAVAMNERLFPGDHPDTANALNNLAISVSSQGRAPEAEPVLVRALDMRKRLFPGDHPDVAESLNNLAMTRQMLGHAPEAEPLLVQALEMNRRLHPGDHPYVAAALNNLADALWNAGKTDKAEALSREALDMRRRLYKRDHHEIALNLNNLALILHNVGRMDEALPLLFEALDMYKRVYPGDHPDTAWTLSNICNVIVDQKKPEEAAPYARQALDMRRRLYPGDHPEVAQSIFGLANVLRAAKRDAEAEPLFVEALEMRRRIYKGDHPDIVTTLRFLAAVRQSLGRATDAEPLCRECLDMARRLNPGDHPSVANAYNSLAQCLFKLDRLPEALDAAQHGAEMARRVFPEGHKMRANCEQSLSDIKHAIDAAPAAADKPK